MTKIRFYCTSLANNTALITEFWSQFICNF